MFEIGIVIEWWMLWVVMGSVAPLISLGFLTARGSELRAVGKRLAQISTVWLWVWWGLVVGRAWDILVPWIDNGFLALCGGMSLLFGTIFALGFSDNRLACKIVGATTGVAMGVVLAWDGACGGMSWIVWAVVNGAAAGSLGWLLGASAGNDGIYDVRSSSFYGFFPTLIVAFVTCYWRHPRRSSSCGCDLEFSLAVIGITIATAFILYAVIYALNEKIISFVANKFMPKREDT